VLALYLVGIESKKSNERYLRVYQAWTKQLVYLEALIIAMTKPIDTDIEAVRCWKLQQAQTKLDSLGPVDMLLHGLEESNHSDIEVMKGIQKIILDRAEAQMSFLKENKLIGDKDVSKYEEDVKSIKSYKSIK